MTDCICKKKSDNSSPPANYPTLHDGGDPVKLFQEHGYFVIRQLLSSEEVESVQSEISGLVSKWYSEWRESHEDGLDWEAVVNRKPAWKEGKWTPASEDPVDVEMGIRRLYRMTLVSKLFDRISKHEKIVPVVAKLIGNDIKLLQSMALLKPPGSTEKIWHQDNGYFRLNPSKLLGVWIALDPANCANGCMHLLPQPFTEEGQFYKHAAAADFHIGYGMVDQPNPNDVVPVVLNLGDALVFHGHLAHYTPPNNTDTRRRSIQFHYASSECQRIKCPKEDNKAAGQGVYFDCDPECQEQKYYYYTKGESLINGRDFGEGYI